uniref:Uncharacterized protein n=1 Tax=Populus alba TaxID=43335 RepID=A0A4U5R5U2_POPAL|nr:hypothetical protein D5086_0000009370 [Populus alba]
MSSAVEINIDVISIPRDHMENEMIDSQLHDCVKQDNPEALKRRVQQRSAEKLVTPCGNTLLHVAVSNGSDNITSYLVKEFPSLITMANSQKDTILHLAAREGKASRPIKCLAESNPSLMRKKNTKGNTPLHDAVIKGNKELAIFLVSKDPEVAYYNNKIGRSPLYLAVENDNKNGILDDLLYLGASIPITRVDGDALPKRKSPVHAAIEQRSIDLLEKIAKAKPELLCLTDEELGNSLHYASSICFLEGVRFLFKKFLDGAYETNSEGNYPIHVACKNESVDLVKEFLDIFPYPKEFLNKKGQNILHVAAENGQGNVVRYIVGNDQKNIVEPLLNEMDEDGNTPLHLAAQHGQSIAAFALVRDKRVENFIVNNENFTPYDVAKQQSKMAVDQYEKTDEMLAKEREQFDSKNSIPADDEIQIEVNAEDVKDGKKNSTTEKATGSQGKDKAVDSKDYKLIDYYGTMTTLSILYFHARPKKSRYDERFTSTQGKPPRKQETRIRIQNLLVVAVLVAGVTFCGCYTDATTKG